MRYRLTKSIGSISSGGKPPSRVASRDHAAGEREQQARALDQQQRLEAVLRHIEQAEYATVGQLDDERDLVAGFGFGVQLQRDLVALGLHGLGAHVDPDLNRGRPWLDCRLSGARGFRTTDP